MLLSTWINKKIHKLHWHDIPFIKLSCILFAFFIAGVFPKLANPNLWVWYLAITIITALKPLHTFFIKKGKKTKGFFKFVDEKIKTMDWMDEAGVETSSVFFGLMLVALCPYILLIHWGWYLATSLLVAAKPICSISK